MPASREEVYNSDCLVSKPDPSRQEAIRHFPCPLGRADSAQGARLELCVEGVPKCCLPVRVTRTYKLIGPMLTSLLAEHVT
jgi:hypothetical protein